MSLAGMMAGVFLSLVTKLLIARSGTQSDYGIYSLATVLVSIGVVVSLMGLESGATRYIAYYGGRGETERVKQSVGGSLRIAVSASVLVSVLLLVSADTISVNLLHEPALALPLRILAIGLPFSVVISMLASAYRGFGRVQEKVYFQDLLPPALFVALLLPATLLRASFGAVFYLYAAAYVGGCAAFLAYTLVRPPSGLRSIPWTRPTPLDKELLVFSLPLLAVALLATVVTYANTLLLGYFQGTAAAGLYSAAVPLAAFLAMPVGATILIYTPVTAALYAQGRMPEMRRHYVFVTKWSFSITFPLFLFLALLPDTVLGVLFGSNYVPASQALRILSLGNIVASLLGPSAALLTVVGQTTFLMWIGVAAAAVNVLLGIALIPPLGIVGAAIATAVALVFVYVARLVKLSALLRVFPLTWRLLRPAAISVVLIVPAYFLLRESLSTNLWTLLGAAIVVYGVHALAILFGRGLDPEDVSLLAEIDKRIDGRAGISTAPLKRVLTRWLR